MIERVARFHRGPRLSGPGNRRRPLRGGPVRRPDRARVCWIRWSVSSSDRVRADQVPYRGSRPHRVRDGPSHRADDGASTTLRSTMRPSTTPPSTLSSSGRGLDARAWRMSERASATVFEVDHPASQQDKLRRIAGLAPAAGRIVVVPVDRCGQTLGLQPRSGSVSIGARRQPGSGRGSCRTLPPTRVRTTLGDIGSVPVRPGQPDCRQLPGEVVAWRKSCGATMRLVLRCGRGSLTGWLASHGAPGGGPISSERCLRDNGFRRDVRTCDLRTLSEGLDLPPDNQGSPRNGRVAVAVRRCPTRRP